MANMTHTTDFELLSSEEVNEYVPMRRVRGTSNSSFALLEELPLSVRGLLAYLSQPEEKANEDLAIAYFRQLYPKTFTRQKEANGADGYVPGSFVLELKGKMADWQSGFFQALAYKNKGLDFNQIVVAARDFLVLWRVDGIPEEIREAVLAERGAPNEIGIRLARKYADRKSELLRLAIWNGA